MHATAASPRASSVRWRAFRALVASAVGASLAACSLGSDSADKTPTADPSAYRMSSTCPSEPLLRPVSASLVNAVVSNTNLPAWQAADIGASVKLSDNRLAWVFGDTIRDDSHVPKIVANSMLISSGFCASQVMAPQDGPVIPDRSEKNVYWPMSVVRLDPSKVTQPNLGTSISDILVVIAARIHRGGKDAFDFSYLGSSAAVFTVQRGQAPQLVEVQDLSPDSNDEHQVNWGAAAMVDGPWYYSYGSRLPGKGAFGRELHAARAPVATPATRARWQFWDGSRWQADRTKSAPILPAEEGVSQTLSVSKTRGQYVVVSKKDGDLGDFVYTWSSTTPIGPWVGRRGTKAPFGVNQDELQYAPLGHPEIPLSSGKLLVSVSRNTTDLGKLFNQPQRVGRPVFTEVDLPVLARSPQGG